MRLAASWRSSLARVASRETGAPHRTAVPPPAPRALMAARWRSQVTGCCGGWWQGAVATCWCWHRSSHSLAFGWDGVRERFWLETRGGAVRSWRCASARFQPSGCDEGGGRGGGVPFAACRPVILARLRFRAEIAALLQKIRLLQVAVPVRPGFGGSVARCLRQEGALRPCGAPFPGLCGVYGGFECCCSSCRTRFSWSESARCGPKRLSVLPPALFVPREERIAVGLGPSAAHPACQKYGQVGKRCFLSRTGSSVKTARQKAGHLRRAGVHWQVRSPGLLENPPCLDRYLYFGFTYRDVFDKNLLFPT